MEVVSNYSKILFFSLNENPPTVFEGLQEFECEIGLFRQLPGTQTFNTRVKDNPLDLGEHVQLWSIIKDGDGKFSDLFFQEKSKFPEINNKNLLL